MNTRDELQLVFIHTLVPLIDVFNNLTKKVISCVKIINILDEPLLKSINQYGKINSDHVIRLQSHILSAEHIHAAAVLVTCSTLSPAVDLIQPKPNIPVIKIDEAMIEQAVKSGPCIGLIATAFSTIKPTKTMLEIKAKQTGNHIEINIQMVKHALDLLLNGKNQEHDQLVKSTILDLSDRVDVIVLAQASMARVLDVIPTETRKVPILSSPYLALQQIKELIS